MATVLIVDDEPHVLRGLSGALRRAPFEILTASSGAEALETLARHPVDVVITDERMPEMSGSELCAEMTTQGHEAVRIILTGQASLEAAVRALNEGCVYRFLHKPCRPAELERTALEAIQLRSMSAATVQMLDAVYDTYRRSMPVGVAAHIKPESGAFSGARAPAFVNAIAAGAKASAPAAESHSPPPPNLDLSPLSDREHELVILLDSGFRLPQIAERMSITLHTARNHLKSVFRKLNVHSQTELIAQLKG